MAASSQMLSRLKSFGLPLGVEKLPVVVDIGAAYTKCGFAGESAPRHIIPSETTSRSGIVYKVYDPEVAVDRHVLREVLIDFFFDIFYKYLLIKTNERRILIAENPMAPTAFREVLADVLFNHYRVCALENKFQASMKLERDFLVTREMEDRLNRYEFIIAHYIRRYILCMHGSL